MAFTVDACCMSFNYETFGLPMDEALDVGWPVACTLCDRPQDVLDGPSLSRLGPRWRR